MNKPTFKANFANGEGSIGNIEKFKTLDPLLRADLLKDWICELNELYDDAVKNMFSKREKK